MRASRSRAAATAPESDTEEVGDQQGVQRDDSSSDACGWEEVPTSSIAAAAASAASSGSRRVGKRGGGKSVFEAGGAPAERKKRKAALPAARQASALAASNTDKSEEDLSEPEDMQQQQADEDKTNDPDDAEEEMEDVGTEAVARRGPARRGRAKVGKAPTRASSRTRPSVKYADGGNDDDELLEPDDEEDEGAGPGGRSSRGKQSRGKKKVEKSGNSLLNKFGFQPEPEAAGASSRQANLDWEYVGPAAAASAGTGKGTGKGKRKQHASSKSKKRSKPDGGASTGTPLKDRKVERRSARSRAGKNLSYAEPSTDISDDGEGGGGSFGEDDSEDDFEDDNKASSKKNRGKSKSSASNKGVAAARKKPNGGGRGRGKGKKPVGRVTVLSKPPPEPSRRSARDKPAVVYDEDAMDADLLEEEEEEEEEESGEGGRGKGGKKMKLKKEADSRSESDGDVGEEQQDGRKRRRVVVNISDEDANGGGGNDASEDTVGGDGSGASNDHDESDDDEVAVMKVVGGGGSGGGGKDGKKKKRSSSVKAAAERRRSKDEGRKKGKKHAGGGGGTKRARRSSAASSSSNLDADDDEDDDGLSDYEAGSDEEEADPEANAAAGRPARRGGRKKAASRTGGGNGGDDDDDSASAASVMTCEGGRGNGSSEEDGSDSESEDDDEEPLKPAKILARKTLTPAQWREICKDMSTDQVTAGSMWDQEDGDDDGDAKPVEKYLVKWTDMSYLHVSWETAEDLIELTTKHVKSQLNRFRDKEFGIELELERGDGEFFDPSLVQLERVLDVDEVEGEETRLLVKWLGAPYSACTYELVKDLQNAGQEYAEAVVAYKRREDMTSLLKLKATRRTTDGAPDLDKDPPVFKNGGTLRDYQREGVRWMVYNWLQGRGSILADEMGLGKTLQTVTFLSILHNDYGKRGPFLVIAPLSTVTHWQREFQTWSDMNTIIFHGDQDDREILEGYEMEFSEDKEKKAKEKTMVEGRRLWKSTVVVTTPELCIRKDVMNLLGRRIHWDLLVVDEAHRLKSSRSKLNVALQESFTFESTLLLTGTPLQNNTEELWTLLNLVDGPKFRDKDQFVEDYGDLQRVEDVNRLQENIKPYLLRRMKEDVEKAVPPKEETIVEVELTEIQKQYYRAIYEQNTTFLLQGKKRAQDGPSLMNLAMELRKCCNHPYLITGVEDAVRSQMGDSGEDKEHLVKHSGKLVLLDKLLPRLKQQGHRVLIFSQFKIMLNILEDYLIASGISYGRIDGSIQGNMRQKAIDSFQAPDSDMFVMLLSTKAGGVGITLTAADTCIIYDSDWNPQNDVQAQARCHRIGQTKSVKVYRLLVAKTYEMHMFKTASKKLGLDQAVLSGSRPQKKQDQQALTKAEVEMLLKHGAYDVFNEGKEGEEASKKFCEDDIESILSRAMVVNHSAEGAAEGKPSNSFSKASFVATSKDAGGEAVDVTDPEFWTKCVGLTVPVEKEEQLGRRAARGGRKDYKDKGVSDDDLVEDDDDESGVNSEFEDVSSGDESVKMINDRHLWSHDDITEVYGALLTFGYGRWDEIRTMASVRDRSLADVAAVCRAMIAVMLQTEAVQQAQLMVKREREDQIVQKVVIYANKARSAAASTPPAVGPADTASPLAAALTTASAGNAAMVGGSPSNSASGGSGSVSSPSPVVAAGAAAAAAAVAAEKAKAKAALAVIPGVSAGSVMGGVTPAMRQAAAALAAATPAARRAAEAEVPAPTEAYLQLAVARALDVLISRHPLASRALGDMRRILMDAAASASKKKDASAAAAVPQPPQQEGGQPPVVDVASPPPRASCTSGKPDEGDENRGGAGGGTAPATPAASPNPNPPGAEVGASRECAGPDGAAGPDVKAVAAGPAAPPPSGGDAGGSGSVVGAGAGAGAGEGAGAARVVEKESDTMAILNQVWKPKNVQVGSKFRESLVRIASKLSTLDEIEDLALMVHSDDPPFGRHLNQVPEGWGTAHDRWLAHSALQQGWFTSMQKRKACKIIEDAKSTWPGLIIMPDHVVLGRRLKQLVAKFRVESAKNAVAARKAEKEKADAAAKHKRMLADMEKLRLRKEQEERMRQEWQLREAKRAHDKAVKDRQAAAAAANKLARGECIHPAHAEAAWEHDDRNAAARARLVGATGGGGGETNPAAALAEILRTQHEQEQQQQPMMRSFLPPGLDASSPNVRTVHDARGKIAGYQVWPSTAETQLPAVAASAAATASKQGGRMFSSNGGGGGGSGDSAGLAGMMQGAPFVGAGCAGGLGRTAGSGADRAMNGSASPSSTGGGPAVAIPMPVSCLSTAEAAAASDDGIMLRHAVHNLGVPVSMLLNSNPVPVEDAAASTPAYSPLRAVLGMSWIRLANGSDLNAKGAESIGVHLLSKAAAIVGDNYGLRLPACPIVGAVSVSERTTLTAMLQSAAKATQLRASLLAYTELKEIQSFAGRLARLRELKAAPMPPWWKPAVHDTHLLLASCIYGSSSDYGVNKAMKETTLAMLQENGLAFAAQEKENNKASGGPTAVRTEGAGGVAASLVPGCQSAEPMEPLVVMTNPPLTPAVAKCRIKALQTAAFVAARRLFPAALHQQQQHRPVVGDGDGNVNVNGDRSAAKDDKNARVVVSGGSGDGDRAHRLGAASGPTGRPAGEITAAIPSTAKRPIPEVVVLDMSGDEEEKGDGNKEGRGGTPASESPTKKAKLELSRPSPQACASPPAAMSAAAGTSHRCVAGDSDGAVGNGSVGGLSSQGLPSKQVQRTGKVATAENGSRGDSSIAPSAGTKAAVVLGGGAAVSENSDAASAAPAASVKKTGTLDSFWSSP